MPLLTCGPDRSDSSGLPNISALFILSFFYRLHRLLDAGAFRHGKIQRGKGKETISHGGCSRIFKRYGIGIDDFVRQVKAAMPFDAVLMTSVMSYWYPGAQKAIDIIRELAGDVPVILGGIYATLYHEHAVNASGADFIFRGPLTEGLSFALSTFGFRLKKKGENIPYYRLNFYTHYPFAPLQTSTGCPFRCAYCASELLSGAKYCRRSTNEVMREIKDLLGGGLPQDSGRQFAARVPRGGGGQQTAAEQGPAENYREAAV